MIMEAYYQPYDKEKLHRMFSETKSYTSLGIGLLVSDGVIRLEDKICQYFPEYLPGKVHPWLEEMTIKDMLRMETCHNMTTYKKTSTTENWVRSFFQTVPTHRPGQIFMYDTSASHTLCALVEKLTGQKLLDFLKDWFFRRELYHGRSIRCFYGRFWSDGKANRYVKSWTDAVKWRETPG